MRYMKTALAATLLLTLALPSFAQLTKSDVEEIMRQALEPIKLDIAEMKGKMATKDDLIALKGEISEMKGKMVTKDEVSSLYRWFILAWITIILAIFAIPYLYGRGDRERVREMEKRMEEMRAEIETLKNLKTILEHQERLKEMAQRLAQEKPEFEEAYKAIGLI